MRVGDALIAPDPDEARRWAEDELSRSIYDEAQPTPLDRFARAVADAIGALLNGRVPDAFGPWLAIAAIAVIVVLLVVAILIWGRPRRVTRSRGGAQPLFDGDDARSAAVLRADAESAAGRGDFTAAVVLRVRALARGLAERTIVDPEPGATVNRFARVAGAAFPGEQAALADLARDFDDVRYLRRPATAEMYARLRSLDDRLAAARAEVLS